MNLINVSAGGNTGCGLKQFEFHERNLHMRLVSAGGNTGCGLKLFIPPPAEPGRGLSRWQHRLWIETT